MAMKRPASAGEAAGAARKARPAAASDLEQPAAPRFLVVSSYTEKLGHVCSPSVPHRQGITVFRVEPEPESEGGGSFGRLVQHATYEVGAEGGADANPSYMAVGPKGDRLYTVSEMEGSDDAGNLVAAYELDRAAGSLRRLGAQETGGAVACHVSVSPDGHSVAVANYMGGSVAMLPLSRDDGRVLRRLDEPAVHSKASKVNPERQLGPHPHAAVFSPSGKHVVVPDLGADEVTVYRVHDGTPWRTGLGLEKLCCVMMNAGCGPRHLAFHPNGRWLYVVNELLSTVQVCHFDPATGELAMSGKPAPTLPDDTPVGVGGKSFCAAIRVSPDGRFVYASNRGHDSLVCFSIDQKNGLLTRKSWQHTGAGPAGPPGGEVPPADWPPKQCPRDFALCGEHGEWVVVANQDADTVVVLRRDVATGELAPTGVSAACPAPVCVVPV